MFKNYIKTAWRSLKKNKLFSFINIFGLALSMSVCMLVMLQIKDEFRYDLFHPYPERTYRVISTFYNNEGEHWNFASSPLPLEGKLKEQQSVVAETVQFYPAPQMKGVYEKKEILINGSFTGNSFFQVFGFTLKHGNPRTALLNPNEIILSSETAEKFFGSQNPVGTLLSVGNMGDFIVSGVLDDMKDHSHLRFDALYSITAVPRLEKAKILPEKMEVWNSFREGYNYVLLKPGMSKRNLSNALAQINTEINKNSGGGKVEFEAQSLSKITPGQDLLNEIGRGTTWGKLLALVGIGFIILLSACFNYTNLTIARALTRAKEVGIRKVAGAKRSQIFFQYIVESVLIALLALVFAAVLLAFILRYNIFGYGAEMRLSPFADGYMFQIIFLFALFTGLMAGAAPAWILSSFKPVQVLKNLTTHKVFGNLGLQKTLIVFQFTLSLVIIIFLTAFYKQFTYMAEADPGFRKHDILTVALKGADEKVLRQEFASVAGVERISALSTNFGRYPTGSIPVSLERHNTRPQELYYYFGDENFVPLMQLKLVAGRNFENSTDAEKHIILNEEAVSVLQVKPVDAIIGKRLWISDSIPVEVIGVVKNFHFQNMGVPIRPMALRNSDDNYQYLNIEVASTDKDRIVSEMQKSWKRMNTGSDFTYFWLEKELYEQNKQTETISVLGYLAFIAISIAALGLLGLVVYTIETRRKEISIRKIIGAEVVQLVLLLSRSFVKLLLIAGFIAMPVGYLLSFIFLQNFASRINFGIGNLLLCFLLLLAIGLVTIISQTFQASTINPVKNLRAE